MAALNEFTERTPPPARSHGHSPASSRMDGRRRTYRLYSQPQPHRLENGRQTAQCRIPLRRKRPVKLRRIQSRLFRHRLHTSKCLCKLTQHGQQFRLIAIFQNTVGHLQRQLWTSRMDSDTVQWAVYVTCTLTGMPDSVFFCLGAAQTSDKKKPRTHPGFSWEGTAQW